MMMTRSLSRLSGKQGPAGTELELTAAPPVTGTVTRPPKKAKIVRNSRMGKCGEFQAVGLALAVAADRDGERFGPGQEGFNKKLSRTDSTTLCKAAGDAAAAAADLDFEAPLGLYSDEQYIDIIPALRAHEESAVGQLRSRIQAGAAVTVAAAADGIAYCDTKVDVAVLAQEVQRRPCRHDCAYNSSKIVNAMADASLGSFDASQSPEAKQDKIHRTDEGDVSGCQPFRQLVPEVEPPAYANLRMREILGDWVETPHGQVVISCDDDDAAYENDILGWLAALDGYFGLVGASERERIRVATSCLAGLARAWWNTRCADAQMGLKPPITSWEVWKHEFVARFKPWNYTRRCWSTLFSLHPKNHANLSDFSTEFMETANKLLPEGLTEEAMLALYCRLVEPELRWVHVAPAKLRDCTSIWDAIMSAIRYAKLTSELLPNPEAQLQQLDPESTAAMRVAPDSEPLWVRRRKRRSRPRRNTLKSILHAAGRPPLSSLARAGSGRPIPLTKRIRSAEENRVLRRGGRCFICAERTHIASTCAYRHQHREWIRTRSSPAFMGHARNSIPQFRSSCR